MPFFDNRHNAYLCTITHIYTFYHAPVLAYCNKSLYQIMLSYVFITNILQYTIHAHYKPHNTLLYSGILIFHNISLNMCYVTRFPVMQYLSLLQTIPMTGIFYVLKSFPEPGNVIPTPTPTHFSKNTHYFIHFLYTSYSFLP